MVEDSPYPNRIQSKGPDALGVEAFSPQKKDLCSLSFTVKSMITLRKEDPGRSQKDI